MTDEVDELLHEDEVEVALSDELETEAEGLRVEDFDAGGFAGDLDEGPGDDADDELDGAAGVQVLTTAKADQAEPAEPADTDEDDLEGLPEDPEASLDEILRAQFKSSDEEGFIDLREYGEEDRAVREFAREDGGAPPRQADEFVCRSCFLVKHHRQLADADRGFCRDCA